MKKGFFKLEKTEIVLAAVALILWSTVLLQLLEVL